jgi:hypothetical protein
MCQHDALAMLCINRAGETLLCQKVYLCCKECDYLFLIDVTGEVEKDIRPREDRLQKCRNRKLMTTKSRPGRSPADECR